MLADSVPKLNLKTERPDLVVAWFKERAFDAVNLREATDKMVWSGLEKKPLEILEAVEDARRGVTYLIALASYAAEAGSVEWSENERYQSVSTAVVEGSKSMASDLSYIVSLEKLVQKLIASTHVAI